MSFTYYIVSKYLDIVEIDKIMEKRGIWRKYRKEDKEELNFFHIDGGENMRNKEYYSLVAEMKNVLGDRKREIIRKDRLYHNLQKVKGGKKFIVENYNIDYKNWRKEIKNINIDDIWIVKPVGGVEGKWVRVIDSKEELVNYFEKINTNYFFKSLKNYFVVQRYIKNPLLIKGRKFHLRIHVAFFQKECFIMDKFIVITAKDKYVQGDYKNNKIHDSHADGTLRGLFFPDSFTFLTKKEKEKIMKDIISLFKKVKMIYKESCYQENKFCYEVFGADVMILEDLSVKILEINGRIGFTSREGKRLNYPGTNKEYKTVLFESEMVDIIDRVFSPSKSIEDESHFIKI